MKISKNAGFPISLEQRLWEKADKNWKDELKTKCKLNDDRAALN